MSKNHGPMVGCNTAITWIENLKGVDAVIQERVIARMRYEFDKDVPVKPRFHKGVCGRKNDYYTCGNCGAGISRLDDYCSRCGFAIEKKEMR